MKILVYPPIDNGSTNPLNGFLYTQLNLLGCSIEAFKIGGRLPNAAIVHVHWPDAFVRGIEAKSVEERHQLIRKQIERLKKFLYQLEKCKANGAKLVWTVHNIHPHEKGNPFISRYFWRNFLELVDGLIFLSKKSQEIALKERPELKEIPAQVIPRGNFKPLAARSPTLRQARNELKIPYGDFVYLFFGKLRDYKNVDKMAREFTRAKTGRSWLIIAGDDGPTKTVGDKLSRIESEHPNIVLDRRAVPDQELLTYISACNVVVLPYKEVLNSAALLMALSCRRRIVCPNLGTMAEIAEMVGPEWVNTYEGSFEAKVFEDTKAKFEGKPIQGPAPLPKEFNWPIVARATWAFYRSLHQAPRSAVAGNQVTAGERSNQPDTERNHKK